MTTGTPRLGKIPWGLAPFLAFMAIFLGLPLFGLLFSSFRVSNPERPRESIWSLGNYQASYTGSALDATVNSITISLIAAVVGSVIGALLTVAVVRVGSQRVHQLTMALSAVLANSGGVSLAFSFIVILGTTGILTQAWGLDGSGFTLYSPFGLFLMYQYFLIPTMVMVLYPSVAGLRPQWREAAAASGASVWQYWRRVGLPILTPALLSGFVLLFGASFATHVSAAALIRGADFPLLTLRIAAALTGGNAVGQENLAMAMGVNMILIALVVLAVYLPLQRRGRAWLN